MMTGSNQKVSSRLTLFVAKVTRIFALPADRRNLTYSVTYAKRGKPVSPLSNQES